MLKYLKEGTQLMHIYIQFITPSQLISPVNGYTCRIISKQNIKNFGFESIKELHQKYPEFPLICEELSLSRSNKAKKEHLKGHNTKVKNNKLKKERLKYVPKQCPKCGDFIPFDKRKNKFCSRTCANSKIRTEEKNKNLSETMKLYCKKIGKKERVFLEYECTCCKITIFRHKESISGLYSCSNKTCIKFLKSKLIEKNKTAASCSKGGKSSAKKQVRRSKQEIELYNLLSMHFSNITHNESIVNGWDADILLHDHKIAILWNGPWHYREMGFSSHSLKQVVNRDCIKIQEFESIGWNVLIYEDRYWTPIEAMIDILLEARGRIERPWTSL
jgi:hypothetical protein